MELIGSMDFPSQIKDDTRDWLVLNKSTHAGIVTSFDVLYISPADINSISTYAIYISSNTLFTSMNQYGSG